VPPRSTGYTGLARNLCASHEKSVSDGNLTCDGSSVFWSVAAIVTREANVADTPRALRISFEFKVPRELNVNIRWVAIEKAMDTLADRMIGVSDGLFPWAKTVKVRKQWVYDWHDETVEIELPATDKNTP
jgi:hypothetical protein